MMDEIEVQHDVEMEYFSQELPGKEQTRGVMDSYRGEIQPSTLPEMLDAPANDRAWIKVAISFE